MSDTRRRPTGARMMEPPRPATAVEIEPETLSRFAHQLRSLLTSVGAAADYLLHHDPEAGVRDEMLGIIAEQTCRIDGLLDDFLVVSSAHPGGGGSVSAVNIYQITRQAVRALAGEAQSAGAWLVLDTAGAVSPVIGHHQPLQQAVTGALRAVIAVARSGERIVARLEDARGDAGERLIEFSVVLQSDDPGLRERTGGLAATDLSLEAARRISERHGGTFEVLDDRPGLACRLPVAPLQIEPAMALRPERSVRAGGP